VPKKKSKKKYITNKKMVAELKSLYANYGGLLVPEAIVQHAKNPKSALHNSFEWNDTVAAQKYRLEQARRLLRVTVEFIEVDGTAEPIRVFCSLSQDREGDGGYRAMVDILNDRQMRAMMLSDALRDIEIFTEKYGRLKELVTIIKAMKKTTKKLRKRK